MNTLDPQYALVDRWMKRSAIEFKMLAFLYAAATPDGIVSQSKNNIALATGCRPQTVKSTIFKLILDGVINLVDVTGYIWHLQIPRRYLCRPTDPTSVLDGLSLSELICRLTGRGLLPDTGAPFVATVGADDEEHLQECAASLLRKRPAKMELCELISALQNEVNSRRWSNCESALILTPPALA